LKVAPLTINVEPEDYVDFKSLTAHPGWKKYQKVLQGTMGNIAKNILDVGLDEKVYHTERGRYQGTKHSMNILDYMVRSYEMQCEKEQKKLAKNKK